MIIGFSLVMAVLLFNLALVVIALLRHRTRYLAKYSTSALVLLMLLGALRLFLPLSFPQITLAIHSFDLLPRIMSLIRTDIWPGSGRLELQTTLLIVWGIGSVVMLLRTIHIVRKLKLALRLYKHNPADNSRAVLLAQKLGMRRASIIVSPDVEIPFVTGIFRACICLPVMDNIPDNEFEMVLRHEYQHFKSCDILVKSFYNMLCIVFWWNPFVHFFHHNLDRLLELRCDAAVKKHMTCEEKATYLSSLYNVMRYTELRDAIRSATASTYVQTEAVDYEKFLEQRFQLIESDERSAKKQIVSVTLIMLVFLASFMFIIQPFHHPPEYDAVDIHVMYDEASFILFTTDGRYKLFLDGRFVYELQEIPDMFANIPIIKEEG
ncbi:MAG: M56 family metallopeptidase [Oscillospiraceae bacterium]|nr:M56 family metallopeptidase [Oscillospiraceae bacterium]